jgi:glycosyltransferase involved in cell wall biosynthesis
MKNLPLVSICIPSYNSSMFIRETLQSILNQTYTNLEIIVCDDRSVDDTVAIVRSFKDPRIELHENEQNIGVERNWNRTLELSQGKYAKVMGADDILYPDCIERQVNVLENPANDDVKLVSSHKNVINQRGKTVISIRFPGKGKFNGITALRMSVRRGTNIIGEPVAGLFRLGQLKESGMFDASILYMIDLDLWSRILKSGNLFIVDRTLFAFRISNTSLSANIGFRQYQAFNQFVSKLASDKAFGLTQGDQFIASVMSFIKVGLRQLFKVTTW